MKCNDSFAAVGQGAGAGACHRTGRKQKHKGLRPIPLPTLTAGLFKACTSKSENAPERDVLIWVIAQMTALPPMGTRSGVGSGFSRTTLQSARASPSLCMRRVTRRIDCSSGLRLCSAPPHTLVTLPATSQGFRSDCVCTALSFIRPSATSLWLQVISSSIW